MISNVFVYYNSSGHRHHQNQRHINHHQRYPANKSNNYNSRTNFNCSCNGPQFPRRRGDSLGHFTSTSYNTICSNTQLLETPDEAKPKLPSSSLSSSQKHGSILEVPIVISNPTTTSLTKPPIANNTQPIQIANSNRSSNNKNLSVSLNIKNSPSRIGMTGGSVNNNTTSSPGGLKIDLTHQSSSSSLISSNSSSNLNQNPDSETNKENNTSFNSPCSSVPTHYGSYSGIYKRLMRSLSNSLISSTGTAVPSSGNMSQNVNDSVNSGSVNLDLTNGEYSSSFKNSADNMAMRQPMEKQRAASGKSNNSFSFKEPDTASQPWICDKCIDSNRYPKYKVGMAILFCLPKARKSSDSTNSTPSSSPLSTSCSPPGVFHEPTTGLSKPTSTTTNSTQSNNKSKLQKQQSYDPIVMFPSSPPQPSSPNQNHNQTLNGQLKSLQLQSQLESQHALSTNNDSFYEFFFSHLPIIEHQIKEFKENLFDSLPIYFQQQQQAHLNRGSFSFAMSPSKQQGNNPHYLTSKCANCIRKMRLGPHLSQKLMMATNSFAQKMLLDLDEYERRFNLLYSSPRLNMPAWLTIMNDRKLTCELNASTRTNANQLATFDLCNNLITEFVDFDKLKKQSGDKPQIMRNNSLSNGHRFILKVEKLKNLLSSQNNLQATESNNITQQTNNHNNSAASSFFHIVMSTILKHHLSWVYTILPSNETTTATSGSHASLRKQRAYWTSILEKTNPYNPLWAQLGDLHGAVNHPLRLVRTVVVGKNQELVERLLQLLSYFIRCSNSSYYDIKAEHFDFERLLTQQTNQQGHSGQQTSSSSSSSLPSASPRTSHKNNKANSTSTIINQDQAENMMLPRYQSSFDETDDNQQSNAEDKVSNLSLDTINLSREVNIFELSINPLSQFTAVLASASAKNSLYGDDQTSVSSKHKSLRSSRQNNNDEFNFISSMSSSSSITSPSSCSMSSSPLTLNLKNLKANSNTIHEGQSKLDFMKQTQQQQQQSADDYKSPESQPPKKKSRNLSSNSNGDNCAAQELPLIGSELKPNHSKSTRMQDNFGYSLLASYCDQFVFEFVLHGTSDRSFMADLHERLVFSKKNSIIDCPIEEAVYIVVDLDDLDVKVFSSETSVPETCDKSIPLVGSMLSSVLNMIKLFKSSEFVLLHLEDKLQELYNKAIALNQLKSQSNFIENDLLIQLMELSDASDLEFLNRILQTVDVPNLF